MFSMVRRRHGVTSPIHPNLLHCNVKLGRTTPTTWSPYSHVRHSNLGFDAECLDGKRLCPAARWQTPRALGHCRPSQSQAMGLHFTYSDTQRINIFRRQTSLSSGAAIFVSLVGDAVDPAVLPHHSCTGACVPSLAQPAHWETPRPQVRAE